MRKTFTFFFVGLLLNASATGDLDSTGRNNAATGFQSSPAGQSMVTGRTLKPPPFSVPPKQPTSPDDWSPENIYGTVDNWQQVPTCHLYFVP